MERIRRFFRKLGKTIGKKGYTLLEVAAVVAVTSTLAAVAMPSVMGKIQEGRVAKATQDVHVIRTAILSFLKDTAVPPFYPSGTVLLASPVLVSVDDIVAFRYIGTLDGNVPTVNTGLIVVGAGGWGSITVSSIPGTGKTIDEQLISNSVLYSIAPPNAWNGPYLPSITKDPWGNKYLVTTKWLAEDDNPTLTLRKERAAFVISAGPNGVIDTEFEQVIKTFVGTSLGVPIAFKVGGDDIISRIK